jgi:hypothetical protein
MGAYNTLQIKFIHCYARHMGVAGEIAAKKWVEMGLAKKFSEIYRKSFFSDSEKKKKATESLR